MLSIRIESYFAFGFIYFRFGGNGTAEHAAAAIAFAIYRTQEMSNLISYMRTYNESAAPGEDLQFYGMDMQRTSYSADFLMESCNQLDISTAELILLSE